MTLRVDGLPTGTPAWRARVASSTTQMDVEDGVELRFVLPPGRWVDLDTLAEATLHGLRDGGALASRAAGLDAVVATKASGERPGVTIAAVPAARLRARRPPGAVALDTAASMVPRPGSRESKRAWRLHLAQVWDARPVLDAGDVWADVALPVPGSILTPLEVVLDALEPVLGRDPRGRAWQEFFPNDHLITWLRVVRTATPTLRLRLGRSGDSWQ